MKKYTMDRSNLKARSKSEELTDEHPELGKKNGTGKNNQKNHVLDYKIRHFPKKSLTRERNLLRSLIDNIPDHVYFKDTKSRFLICNKVIADWFQTNNGDIVGKTDFDFIPHKTASLYYSEEQKLIKTGKPIVNKIVPLPNNEGKKRWTSITKVPLRNRKGVIIGLLGLDHDITHHKKIQDELQTLLNISNELILSKNFQEVGKSIFNNLEKYEYVNISGGKLAVYDEETDLYHTVYSKDYDRNMLLFEPDCKLKDVKYYSKKAIHGKKTLLIADNHSKYSSQIDKSQKKQVGKSMIFIPLYHSEKFVGLFSYSCTPKNSMDKNFIGLLENIAKLAGNSIGELLIQIHRVESEKALYKARESLRDLSKHFLLIQENEKKSLAHEIQEEINQILVVVKLNIEFFEREMISGGQNILKFSSRAKELLDDTIDILRGIAYSMQSNVLDKFGLIAAIEEFCWEFNQIIRIDIDIQSKNIPLKIPSEIQTNIFRVIQEAMKNVAVHSEASKLLLRLNQKKGWLLILIKDNGIGFDTSYKNFDDNDKKKYGIVDMRERIGFVDGTINIISKQKRGTKILIKVPLQKIHS